MAEDKPGTHRWSLEHGKGASGQMQWKAQADFEFIKGTSHWVGPDLSRGLGLLRGQTLLLAWKASHRESQSCRNGKSANNSRESGNRFPSLAVEPPDENTAPGLQLRGSRQRTQLSQPAVLSPAAVRKKEKKRCVV